jgi:predicted DCC family thiol-disulfide oxidoreductase YuxK
MGARPLLESDKSIVFFDTHCLLCSRFINIILKNDKGSLYFSGFDSQKAAELLPSELRHEPSTVVFSKQGKLFFKSEAIFEIIKELRFPWPILQVFKILPISLNDAVYGYIAKNRFRWFGRADNCFLPTPDQKARFFDL